MSAPAPAISRPPAKASVDSLSAPLALPIFLLFWLAALVSNVGSWMQNVGAGWLMTSLSRSSLMVALIQSATSMPMFLLSLPAGALADIVDRRKLLIFAQTWMLLAAAALGFLTMAGAVGPWTLLALTFILGIGNALNAPAWLAAVHDLVTPELFTSAMALVVINVNVSRALGPALAGYVVQWAGAGWTFQINAISFLAVILVLFAWRRVSDAGLLPAERVVGAMKSGLEYLRHSPPLTAVLVRTAVFGVGATAMWAMLPAIARHQMRSNAAGFGLLMACAGLGAGLGGIAVPKLAARLSRDQMVGFGTACYTITLTGLALIANLKFACLMMVLGGVGWIVATAALNILTQLAVPQWMRGRSVALFQMTFHGSMAAGSALWGTIAVHYGLPASMAAAALAMGAGLFFKGRFSLNAIDQLSFKPAETAAAPALAGQISAHGGPVMVTIEYQIDPAQRDEFSQAMEPVRTIRLRNGAFFWGLFVDAARPARFIEYFMVESWLDYLRQRERLTADDRELEERAQRYHRAATPPLLGHQLDAETIVAGAFHPRGRDPE